MPNLLVRLEKKREKKRTKSNFIIEMSETLQCLLAFSLSIISVLCNILGLFNKRTFCTFVFIELHLLGNYVSSSQSFPLWRAEDGNNPADKQPSSVSLLRCLRCCAICTDTWESRAQRTPFLRPRPHVSGYFWIRNFFFPDLKISPSTRSVFKSNSPVHTHPMISGFTLVPRVPLH